MPKAFGEKISRSKKGKKPNISEETRKEMCSRRTYLNLVDNPAKKPAAKEKLREAYYNGITLGGRGKNVI